VNDNEPNSSSELEKPDSVGNGIGMLLLLHLLQFPMALFSAWIAIGISQLVYVIPYGIKLSREGRKQSLKGLMIGAGITFLLNTACFGVFMVALGH